MRYRAIGPALLLLCCLAGTPALAAVDMGLPVATLKVVVTNGGVDAGDKGGFEVRPAGQHTADVIAYERTVLRTGGSSCGG